VIRPQVDIIAPMLEEATTTGVKLPLDDSEAQAVQRLGKWMRIVGTIQLAMAGMLLLLLGLGMACGAVLGDMSLAAVFMLGLVAAFLLQALRIQAAGEQFKNLADERDADYLELAFDRLKTVYIVDVVIVVLIGGVVFGGSL
jgi:hypothetical protein